MINKRRKKLAEKRKSKRLSAEEIAERVGISVSYYYFIEAGQRNPSYSVMKKIADILGVKPDYIFFED